MERFAAIPKAFFLCAVLAGVSAAPAAGPKGVATSKPAASKPADYFEKVDNIIRQAEADWPISYTLRATGKDARIGDWPDYSGWYRDGKLFMMAVDYWGEDSDRQYSYFYDGSKLVAIEIYHGRFSYYTTDTQAVFKTNSRHYFLDGMCIRCVTDGKVGRPDWAELNEAIKAEPVARRAIESSTASRPATEKAFQALRVKVVEQVQAGKFPKADIQRLHKYLSEKIEHTERLWYEEYRQSDVVEAIIATGSIEWMNELRGTNPSAMRPQDILRFAGTKPAQFFSRINPADKTLLNDVQTQLKLLWRCDAIEYIKAIDAYAAKAPAGPRREAAMRWSAAIQKHSQKKEDELPVIYSADRAKAPV